MNTTTYQIDVPHACCGVVVNEAGVVIKAAPILQWAVGQRFAKVTRWVELKGGTVTRATPG